MEKCIPQPESLPMQLPDTMSFDPDTGIVSVNMEYYKKTLTPNIYEYFERAIAILADIRRYEERSAILIGTDREEAERSRGMANSLREHLNGLSNIIYHDIDIYGILNQREAIQSTLSNPLAVQSHE